VWQMSVGRVCDWGTVLSVVFFAFVGVAVVYLVLEVRCRAPMVFF